MDEIQRAKAAKRLIEDPLFNEAFELIENNLTLDFKMCKPSDIETLQLTKLQLNGLYSLKRAIFAMASATGETDV